MRLTRLELAAILPPKVMAAYVAARTALAGDSNDDEHDALWALVEALEKCRPTMPLRSDSMSREAATEEVPVECIKMNVPTYNGKWILDNPGLEDYDEPEVPILIHPAEGLRVVLGTHDFFDMSKSDIQLERRHNGWLLFLRRDGGDPVGFVVFLDDGRTYVTIERGWGIDEEMQVVDYETAVAELDDIKPDGLSCSPMTIVERRQREN